MKEINDKYSLHQTLVLPTKLFEYPTVKDKINALNYFGPMADISDIEYVYPLVFENSMEIAKIASQIVADIMSKIQGKYWNIVYDRVRYTRIKLETLDGLMKFNPDISVHLLGIATLNSSGYIREKALSLISGLKNAFPIPYILLRLNDWVMPVRNLAEQALNDMFATGHIDVFIKNAYLINKLQNVSRVDLKGTSEKIVNYLKVDSYKDKIKMYLKNPNVKTRLFCYMLFSERLAKEEDVIDCALGDKSFEIRMWLVKAISTLENEKRNPVIGRLLWDKSAKVKISVLRNFEDVVCSLFKERLELLLVDKYASVRDEARYIAKKHLFITDFAEFYKKQIDINPVPGALLGLGETGNKSDFGKVYSFYLHEESRVRLAAMIAMWYLCKEDAVTYIMESLDSNIPKVRKTAKQFLGNSKMPVVLFEMKKRLLSDNPDTRLFAIDLIYGYGGWQALECILFAIINWQDQYQEKAKILLDSWLIKSSTLYSRPDSLTRGKIVGFLETIKEKGFVPEKNIRELQFVLDTRS